jgi:hypothetical protein
MRRTKTMRERKNRSKIAGLVLHVLTGGLLIVTGSQKILGPVPPEALVKYGLDEQVRLIGTGAIITALLLLIPRMSSLGILFEFVLGRRHLHSRGSRRAVPFSSGDAHRVVGRRLPAQSCHAQQFWGRPENDA